MADDLSHDLEELRKLRDWAKRPRVVSIISSEIDRLEKLLKRSDDPPAAQVPAPIATAKVVPASRVITYTTLGSFSWDQDNDKVKMYISLEGVDKEKIETDFKSNSVDIKIHDVNGKNYRCVIPKLNKEIEPGKCKVLVKPTRIIVTLAKASKGSWLDLHLKDDKLKPGLDKEKDPMAGIMDLMKNMYEDGDDEMKRTIAKAWSDARSGNTADPLKGYR